MSTAEIKRAQIALRKFQEVAQLHLDILKERRDNIRKYRKSGDHKALSIEKSRADIVVKQLYDDVQQMFTWCSDLQAETWEWVQRQLRPLNTKIQSNLSDFLNECGGVLDEPSIQSRPPADDMNDGNPFVESSSSKRQPSRQMWPEEESNGSVEFDGEQSQKTAVLGEELDRRRMEADTHRQLLSDILELNEAMKELDAVVKIQGDAVDSIDQNVERASTNVDAGERNLFKAMKLKAASYPIAGAIIGAGAAAGPVGLLVGLKVGIAAAIGGSAIGAVSGHFLRKRALADERASMEMRRVSTASSSTSASLIDAKSNRRKID